MELLQQAVMQLEHLMQRARRSDDTSQYLVLRNAQQLLLNEILGVPQSGLRINIEGVGDVKVPIRHN